MHQRGAGFRSGVSESRPHGRPPAGEGESQRSAEGSSAAAASAQNGQGSIGEAKLNCDLPERGGQTRLETEERAFLPNVVRPGGRRALVLAMTASAFALALAVIASAQTPAASVETNKAASGFLDVEALIKEGQFETAKAKLQEELQVHPSSAEAYSLLGIVYSAEKDFQSALEAFQHAAKLDPKSAKARNNLGNTYVAQQNLDAAEREFRSAAARSGKSG